MYTVTTSPTFTWPELMVTMITVHRGTRSENIPRHQLHTAVIATFESADIGQYPSAASDPTKARIPTTVDTNARCVDWNLPARATIVNLVCPSTQAQDLQCAAIRAGLKQPLVVTRRNTFRFVQVAMGDPFDVSRLALGAMTLH
mgnify:CR=1 FL=1